MSPLEGFKPAECINHRREERERLTIDESDKGVALARPQMHTQRQTDQRTRMLDVCRLLLGIQLHTRRAEGQEPSPQERRRCWFPQEDPQVSTTPGAFEIRSH